MDADTPLDALLAQVARGQQSALRIIYNREGTRLFGIAMAILRDRAAAADAVQDAFLRLWQRAGQYDPSKGHAQAWLGAVVRYAALDAARARGREFTTDDPTLGDQAVDPEAFARLAAGEDGRKLRGCLGQLDERNMRFIVLAFVHGMSHAQIAAKLELPLGSTKSWIRRALMSLRACMA